ncbi:MAG: asparagine synthase C-terminal domain-containing protein [candidate division KSB1 bacterium]|nr:asparagine synthase C-terminal domain-containing protein [candidate division KSB1 bacterium]MDZ7275998.1 asparagine synthase C-terminal domain-containing protein [candidate division KSB1 bacterium]MDZ7285720.1 asparagine synthase C-terminal domain-containing protein [candidate division KSB1 bacterium]MDZ7298752.1 asparagine synthase C-terminal domain-containing protein [candidate division KSB1 bacterium]MDZ7305935.1 asparagine synthase C-terminal domain-containing protein [candidate division
MIFGVIGQVLSNTAGAEARPQEAVSALLAMAFDAGEGAKLQQVSTAETLVALRPAAVPTLDAGPKIFQDEKGSFVALLGNIFNRAELVSQHLSSARLQATTNAAEIILRLYFKLGEKFCRQLNGNFVIALYDAPAQRFYLYRDHLGIEPVYYSRKAGVLYFCSRLRPLTALPAIGREINHGVLQRYLLFNYNPGYDSIFAGIATLRPGFFIKIDRGRLSIEQYWRPSFAEPFRKEVATYKAELLELLRDAVRLRLVPGYRAGAFLSGGMDSSSVVHFMRGLLSQPIASFSFRCQGKTFDESHYARVMSERYGTEHHQVEYTAEDAARHLAGVAQAAQEPFSDIGIEIASWLLGAQVREHADYVLTGDGGDELFGGHPVYLADRAAKAFNRIPAFIRQPLTKTLQLLPDTDSKKSLVVKAKRFSYSSAFPAALHSNRWRIYYTEAELRRLCLPEMRAQVNGFNPFAELLEIYGEADGRDELSLTLYGDYYSVVGFYLRRMELIRQFGVEGRMPLLDYRLVDYTARIPSELKIGRRGETKLLLHKIMAGELPDEIVFRKDKLGHSVPMKNWMRESAVIQNLFHEYLSPEQVKRRGFFDHRYIAQLIREHRSKAHNHSHRLWGLLMFELWCRAHLDR